MAHYLYHDPIVVFVLSVAAQQPSPPITLQSEEYGIFEPSTNYLTQFSTLSVAGQAGKRFKVWLMKQAIRGVRKTATANWQNPEPIVA